MITKRIEHGVITILADNQVQVRTDTVIEEDGVELSRTYHREVLEPSLELPGDPRLRAIVSAIWTPVVVETFARAKAERLANDPIFRGVPDA